MIKKIFLTIVLFISVAGIAQKKATFLSEATPGIDFSKYKTYAYRKPKDTSFAKIINKQSLEEGLVEEVGKQLDKRKMILDVKNPQVIFTYTMVMKHDYKLNGNEQTVYNAHHYQDFYSNRQIFIMSTDNNIEKVAGKTELETLLDGSLVIDMIDTQTHEVVWRSTMKASKYVDEIPTMKQTLDYIIPKMFKKFPIKK